MIDYLSQRQGRNQLQRVLIRVKIEYTGVGNVSNGVS